MEKCLELAKLSQDKGDIPVAALVCDKDGKIIASSHNERELGKDPTAHAEIIAIREASKALGQWRLTGCTLVVTLEPCVMCAGALSLSRVDRVVFGAYDKRAGAMGSIYEIHNDKRLNHVIELEHGVLENQCRETLVQFFKSKRK
jgi:tRNA(adenine34) deaminase